MRFLTIGAARAEPAGRLAETETFLLARSFTRSGTSCGRMASCAEACHARLISCHALLICGERRRDGDGIPCDSLCGARC